MRNIRLEIEYQGTDYCGWQVQNRNRDKPSIQAILQKTLRNILQEEITVTGSGRTDAGVHAIAQVANFKTTTKLGPAGIQRALNSLLPPDIAITGVRETDAGFCSCRQAKAKIYRYIVLSGRGPSAFWERFSWYLPYRLDIGLMREEAKALLGRHDFSAFCASSAIAKGTVRTIKGIRIKKRRYTALFPDTKALGREMVSIDIEADGFLYNMVRNIVGTLVDIGRQHLGKGALKKILVSRDRRRAGQKAPACGLFLLKVKY